MVWMWGSGAINPVLGNIDLDVGKVSFIKNLVLLPAGGFWSCGAFPLAEWRKKAPSPTLLTPFSHIGPMGIAMELDGPSQVAVRRKNSHNFSTLEHPEFHWRILFIGRINLIFQGAAYVHGDIDYFILISPFQFNLFWMESYNQSKWGN